MRRTVLILLTIQAVCLADEGPLLTQIRAILEPLRKRPLDSYTGVYGGAPESTQLKHLLRDWVESRLPPAEATFDEAELSKQLTRELINAHLACEEEEKSASPCPDPWNLHGFLGEIEVKRQSGFLTVVTGVGIACSFDESVYAYHPEGAKWIRFFESEQNDYRDKHYFPQRIAKVAISGTDFADGADRNRHLILTLGYEGWCSSNWHYVYVRVWGMNSSNPNPKLLVDQSEWAFEPWDIEGSVSSADALIEYQIAGAEHIRPEIRHYRVDSKDRVTRIDPLALSPADFVEEWRIRPWETSSAWTQRAVRSKLKLAYDKLNVDVLGLEFRLPTTHCADHPDLWEVNVGPGRYFLVRWQPPYRFTMVDVSPLPLPQCREIDPVADQPRTLFPH